MGFFSFIGSLATAAVGGLKAIGGALAKGAGALLSSVGGWIAEKIFNLGDLPSYDTKTATVDQTKKVNELLEKCITGYGKEAEEYDLLAQIIIKNNFDIIENKLIEINEISDMPIIDDFIFRSFQNNTKKQRDRKSVV